MQLELLPRVCPLCRSSAQSTVYAEADFDPAAWDALAFASRKPPEYMHYRLMICEPCDLLYAGPAPGPRTTQTAYEEADFDSALEAGYAAQTYASFVPRILRRLPDRNGALDIGTGDGAFLGQLLAQGVTEVAGVEPSVAAIASGTDSVRPLIRTGAFRAADFDARRFRLVTCFQTIEHLHDPLSMCREVFGLLKDEGAFFIVCHNRRAMVNRALGMRSPIMDIEHLQLFSPRSVRAMLERSGFADVTVAPIANRYPLRYWLRLAPLPAALKRGWLESVRRSRIGLAAVALPVGNLAVVGYKRTQA